MHEPRLAASITRTLLGTAARLGLDRDALLAEIGLTRASVDDPDARILVRQHIALFRLAAARSGRPDFALEVGRSFRPGTLRTVGLAAMHAPNLRTAWAYFVRYWQCMAEGTRLSLREQGDEAVVAFEMVDPRLPFAREGSESITAGHVTFARWLTQEHLRPVRVCFSFPEPRHADLHRQLFDAPVEFDAERPEVHWASSVLERPVLAADPELEAWFETRLRDALAAFEASREPAVLSQVRALVLERLDRGAALDEVARCLALSRRSLQRRLTEAGTSYHRLVDESRRELAFRLLRDPELALEDAAFLLGFAEPASFFRAFRRWTGTTPATWRVGQRRIETPDPG